MLKRLKWACITLALALAPVLTRMNPLRRKGRRRLRPAGPRVLVRSGLQRQDHGQRSEVRPARTDRRTQEAAARHQGYRDEFKNGKTVEVEINDRGPYVGGRILDLSKAAADQLGMKHAGTARSASWLRNGSSPPGP